MPGKDLILPFKSDLEASIDEQAEEFENFGKDRRHSIILRKLWYHLYYIFELVSFIRGCH